LLLDLRQFHDLLEAAAIAVGNPDVAAGALHDLARDGEPEPALASREKSNERCAVRCRRSGREVLSLGAAKSRSQFY
jgi:hypothetical protein